MKCGVIQCGHPDDCTGVVCQDIGKLARPATRRLKNPVSGAKFLCCDECFDRAFSTLGLIDTPLTTNPE